MPKQHIRLKRLKITISPWLLRSYVTVPVNRAQAIVFISVWLTLVVNDSWLTNILLGLSAPTLDKFCRDFWKGQTNFVSPVLPGLMKQCMESVITFYQNVPYDNDSLYLLLLKRLFGDYLQWCVSTACKVTNVFLMTQLCIVFKKIKYEAKQLYLQCCELGAPVEYLIPSCLFEKEPLQLCFIDLRKKAVVFLYAKTWSWDVSWLFWRKFMAIRFFSDPVRVLSIGRNPIQVLLIRSDPVRVLLIRSDPIRSRFCKRPNKRASLIFSRQGRPTYYRSSTYY